MDSRFDAPCRSRRLNRLSLVGSLFCALGCAGAAVGDWFSEERTLMGTSVRVEIWSANAIPARRVIDGAFEEIARIEARMSTWRDDSELSHINRSAAAEPVPASEEVYRLLARSLEISRRTHWAFDVTYAAAGKLYDYRKGIRPDDQTLQATLDKMGPRRLILDADRRTVAFDRAGVRIDLGGIAKGYAVERAVDMLRRQGVQHALVAAGGDTRFLGDRNGQPWTVSIRAPRDPDDLAAVLPVVDEAVSTSGDYERYFEADGIRYHHILDPQTGRSADAVTSVTVIGPDATLTDALATGLFVLGVAEGLNVLREYPGFDAVFVDARGQLTLSPGIRRKH